MSRVMWDGVSWQASPAKAGEIVALYSDGLYAAPPDATQHFRALGVQVVYITVLGDPGSGICDVETGDVSPRGARNYVRARRALGHLPTIYSDLSNLPAVRQSCAGLDYAVIVADPTGLPHEIPGAAGVQWLWSALWDETAISDPDWHRAQ